MWSSGVSPIMTDHPGGRSLLTLHPLVGFLLDLDLPILSHLLDHSGGGESGLHHDVGHAAGSGNLARAAAEMETIHFLPSDLCPWNTVSGHTDITDSRIIYKLRQLFVKF